MAEYKLTYDPETGLFKWDEPTYRHKKGWWPGMKYPHGYFMIQYSGKVWLAHRLAYLLMTGHEAEANIDHINGDASNNRWANLRVASWRGNAQNAKLRADNTSGFKGVCKRRNHWIAQIGINGKQHVFGKFGSPEDAARAYDCSAKEHFGEFARTNEMLGLFADPL